MPLFEPTILSADALTARRLIASRAPILLDLGECKRVCNSVSSLVLVNGPAKQLPVFELNFAIPLSTDINVANKTIGTLPTRPYRDSYANELFLGNR